MNVKMRRLTYKTRKIPDVKRLCQSFEANLESRAALIWLRLRSKFLNLAPAPAKNLENGSGSSKIVYYATAEGDGLQHESHMLLFSPGLRKIFFFPGPQLQQIIFWAPAPLKNGCLRGSVMADLHVYVLDIVADKNIFL